MLDATLSKDQCMIELAKDIGMEMEDIQKWASVLKDFQDDKE